MKLKEVLSVSGLSGLYKMVAQTKSGLIVESLADGKRQAIDASHRASTLSDIVIYTSGDQMPLKEVSKKISDSENGEAVIDGKAEPEELKKYFKKLIPEIDDAKVH